MTNESICIETAFLKISNGPLVLIDQEDYDRASKVRWRAVVCKKGIRRTRILSTIRINGRRMTVSLERFLACPQPGKIAYAMKAEEFDYRKKYISCCHYRDRQRQLSKRKNKTTSRYKGVSFLKRISRWRASIQVDGKSINLGNFFQEWHAALAYNLAAIKYFGSGCFLNEIDNSELTLSGRKK